MKPVFQDMFYEPGVETDKQRGNCMSACYASLLELELHEVPNFVQIDVEGGKNWWQHAIEFLWERGLCVYWITEHTDQPEEGEYYLVFGLSPRGNDLRHIVVFQNGEMVHDPHPDNTGLLSHEGSYMIRPR